MGENAELWSQPDEKSQRITLECWLQHHNIQYDSDMTNEELRQLYIDVECGRIHTLAQLSWLKRTADNRKRSGSIPDASTISGSTW